MKPSQKYIFDSVVDLFGNDMGDNINFFITYSDMEEPPVLNLLIKTTSLPWLRGKKDIIPYHKFNNSGFLESILSNEEMAKTFWKMGMNNFVDFFKRLDLMKPKRLRLTKEVTKERQRLESAVNNLKSNIKYFLEQMAKLEATEASVCYDLQTYVAYKKEKENLTTSCLSDVFEITESLTKLNDIALRPELFTPPDYINELINQEQSYNTPGVEKRINILRRLLNRVSSSENTAEPDGFLKFFEINDELKNLNQQMVWYYISDFYLR